MAHSSIKRMVNLQGLERLHGIRIKACEARYLEMKRKREEAARSVNEREASISSLKKQRSDLFLHLGKAAVAETPLRAELVHERRYWVEYDLEKDEYYLEMDLQDLNAAEMQLSQARQEWLRQQQRQDLVQRQLFSMQRDLSRYLEMRETED